MLKKIYVAVGSLIVILFFLSIIYQQAQIEDNLEELRASNQSLATQVANLTKKADHPSQNMANSSYSKAAETAFGEGRYMGYVYPSFGCSIVLANSSIGYVHDMTEPYVYSVDLGNDFVTEGCPSGGSTSYKLGGLLHSGDVVIAWVTFEVQPGESAPYSPDTLHIPAFFWDNHYGLAIAIRHINGEIVTVHN